VVWQGSAGNCRPYADQTGIAATLPPFAKPNVELAEIQTFEKLKSAFESASKLHSASDKAEAEFSGIGDVRMRVIFSYT
jgi:hypothetical protein